MIEYRVVVRVSDSFSGARISARRNWWAESTQISIAARRLTFASCRVSNSATNGTLIGIVAVHTAENELSQVY